MAGDQKQFECLLEALMSPENSTRTETEEVYDKIPTAQKLTFLVQTLRSSDNALEARTLGAVLLRRLFTTDFTEWWPTIPQELQAAVKSELMKAIQEELTPPVKRKVCDAASELARHHIDDNNDMNWAEFLQFMFDCANSEDPSLRESALHIFSTVPGIFGNSQAQYLDVIKQMLSRSLQDHEHPHVWFEAVKATAAFVTTNEEEEAIINQFRSLVPGMLQAISESINQQDDDALLKCLIEMAEVTPKFLRQQAETVFTLCLKVLSDSNLPDSWRQLGLEAIVTLSESAPGLVRKHSKFIPMLVPQLMAMMLDLEEEEDWSLQDELESEDEESNPVAGESALDRLSLSLGGKAMMPHILANATQMLQNTDWRYRRAALMAISCSGEGCHAQMEKILGEILSGILPFIKDPHPRVRFACLNAIGQISTDFGPNFQKKFHSTLIPELLLAMDDEQNPRVQTHAAAALVNFSEECPKNILIQHLDSILGKLESVLSNKIKELLEKGTKMVLEQMVTTLASVADTAEEKFTPYYERFMPCLKYIVQNATSKEYKMLRGKTIECISLIGLAVGKDKFMLDCSDVMQLLLKAQTDMGDLPDDDPQISYMMAAWTRMCKIVGKQFEEYLPMVMGPVLKAASLKPEVTVMDSEDLPEVENDPDWNFVTLGDQHSFGIRTAGLEEKSTACQMLVCYARELKEGFSNYAEEVVKIMVPLLKFFFHDEVRSSAAESLPYLLECAKVRGEEYVSNMWTYICPNLLTAIEVEPERPVLPELMGSLAKCIENLGKGCLTDENMQKLMQVMDKILNTHFERQHERQDKRKDEDYDDVTEEQLLEEDDEDVYILTKVSDLVHVLFYTYKQDFTPHFDSLLPHFVKLSATDRPWPDRQWGICIWDDVLEHLGPDSVKYQQYFLQNLLDSICDNQAEVRQAASYGVGVMAQFGGEAYGQSCTDAMPRLLAVIQAPDSREVENVSPTENAISAITKICKYQNVSVNEVLPHWLSWLPVWEDEDEAVHIYNYLCELVETHNPIILGENHTNLPLIVKIIAEALVHDALEKDEDMKTRVLNIVRQIQTNPAMAQSCLSVLSPEQQQALSEALATPAS